MIRMYRRPRGRPLRHAPDLLVRPGPSREAVCRCWSRPACLRWCRAWSWSVGTFFAQAAATGFVGRAATGDRGSAGGFYLASYFCGGLVDSVALRRAFDTFGWGACVAGVGAALALAAGLAFKLRLPTEQRPQKAESFC